MSNVVDIKKPLIHEDPWKKLRQFTDARIGLGRVGTSIPTDELLAFQLSHAQAIDAVHVPLDINALEKQFAQQSSIAQYLPAFHLHSQADDRITYLQRPDLGRRLNEASMQTLKHHSDQSVNAYDLAIVVVDGLSSHAIAHHAMPFIEQLLTLFERDQHAWRLAPIAIVEQGRVAVGDDVGEALNANEVLVLVGERPGLSSPDSLGLYLTWNPTRGKEDSLRNCISNVRPQGLKYEAAAHKCFYLLKESRRIKLTGVGLKDRSEESELPHPTSQHFSLTQSS
ncbi:ethanolamine ammonia-lyase subunit EutC [Vibrio olivae]|uniref:Ethanolamine ammonia-lyase small subunit n=1 Tax=Vibrio olivae TaxID=1243002 RepID=A0ABV5HPS1_9VIBR